MQPIARIIKRARDDKGWTQDELATAMGVSPDYIASLESGRIKLPSPDRFAAIERALGISRASMLRDLGYLGPEEAIDIMAAFQRIVHLESDAAKLAAIDALPQPIVEAIRLLIRIAAHQAIERSLHRPAE